MSGRFNSGLYPGATRIKRAKTKPNKRHRSKTQQPFIYRFRQITRLNVLADLYFALIPFKLCENRNYTFKVYDFIGDTIFKGGF